MATAIPTPPPTAEPLDYEARFVNAMVVTGIERLYRDGYLRPRPSWRARVAEPPTTLPEMPVGAAPAAA